MQGQKSHIKPHGGGWFNRELKIFVLLLGLISFSNLIFSNNTSALFTPTLSASVDNTAASVNGNQVINSTNKTTEIPLNLIVNTNNKTGYTATLNSETNETALVNAESATGAKIESIDANKTLAGFSDNTWGVKIGSNTNFSPIPKPTSPMNVMQTAGKSNGSEANSIKIGMKLGDNLESGRYTNKLVFSILTNDYNQIAIMTEGPDFNIKLKSLETPTSEINYFRKSPVPPATSMNAVNIDDEESDYEIKLWLDPTDNTAYYYAEPEKVYLNRDSSKMFYSEPYVQKIRDVLEIDLSNFDTSKVTNMSSMFLGMTRLTTLNLSNFNTSQVTNMAGMFGFMASLTSLNLINFDTSQVTNMAAMFSNIVLLTTLDLSNFNTSKVTNMSNMFNNMASLTTLDLSSFDTSNVTDMRYMLSSMRNLTTLDLSNFDTSQVAYMNNMFSGTSLTSLNLSNFDTSKVMNMSNMFRGMSSLTTLDLSNFDTSRVTNMEAIFFLEDEDIPKDKLEKIYVNNDFDVSKLTAFSNMFRNRKKLRGGNGSYLADPSTADKTWLRVDRSGVQGYFTRKP